MNNSKKLHFINLSNSQSDKNVIILHGFLGSSSNWRFLAKKLPYNIFLVDLRNHGYSFHSDEMSYPAMAEDILNFCHDNNLKNVHLIGHSMGGKIALQCLNQFEKIKISSITVIDIWAKKYEPRHDKILNSLKSLNLNQTRQQIENDLIAKLKEETLSRFLLKNLTIDKNSSHEIFTWRNNLKILVAKRDFLLAEILLAEKINIPCFLVKGSNSDYVLGKDIEEMQQKFTSQKFIIIENSGHWVHVDSPNLLLSEIINFIDKF